MFLDDVGDDAFLDDALRYAASSSSSTLDIFEKSILLLSLYIVFIQIIYLDEKLVSDTALYLKGFGDRNANAASDANSTVDSCDIPKAHHSSPFKCPLPVSTSTRTLNFLYLLIYSHF